MGDAMISVNSSDFEEKVVQSAVPVLLDFWAPWCGPCKMITPILEELSSSYAGRVNLMAVNVDEETTLAEKFDVRGIPCLIIFKEGSEVDRRIGALTKSQVIAFLDEHC